MITVTEQAAAKIRDLLAEQEDAELALRHRWGRMLLIPAQPRGGVRDD